MLRILITVLLAVSSVVSGLNPKDVSGSPLQVPQSRSMHVTVSFVGLMVFHPETGRYDVGILVDPHHRFEVLLDGQPQIFSPTSQNDKWSLSVVGTPPDTTRFETGHNGRYPDSGTDLYDLSWMVDFDELHRGGLTVNAGLLYPIIRLNNGFLYTRNKTEYMQRFKGGAFERDFGFLSETVSLDVEVRPDQIFLLAEDRVGGEPIVRLPYRSDQLIHEVVIKNARHPSDNSSKSDFRLYYKLFSNIKSADQYDFQIEESIGGADPKYRSPLNPAPRHIMLATESTKVAKQRAKVRKQVILTCCGYECNPTLMSTTALR